MKVTIEKLPAGGVKVSITYDTAKRPLSFTVPQGQAATLAEVIRVAESAATFRFEMQLG